VAGLTVIVPFVLEDRLNEGDGIFSKAANWARYVQVDGKLATGQSPASSEPRCERAAAAALLWLTSNLIHWKELDRGDHLAALRAA
jgi:hypothetical protein